MRRIVRSQEASAALEAYRFDEYAAACYRFTWDTFCDWFVEFAKPALAETEVRQTAAYVLGTLLRLLHPVMPFVTEELWDRFGYGEPSSLIRTPWPEPVIVPDAAMAREELDWVVRLISEVRSVRTEMNVPPSALTPILLRDAAPETLARGQRWIEAIRRLARASDCGRWMARCRRARRSSCWTRRQWCCRLPMRSMSARSARA